MTAEEVKALPIAQKIQIMEALGGSQETDLIVWICRNLKRSFWAKGVHGLKRDPQDFTIGIR